ncbi:MAG TPA: response regulator [Thermoanaerobaculia bacterium]|nr:response regulator [Thermoanaerobaculia bacterium]
MALTSLVLIVDDHDDTREMLDEILRQEGFSTRVARDGREALDILASSADPCAILLDHRMPNMDGVQFLDFRASHPALARAPVIFVSGDPNGLAEAAGKGAVTVRKPYQIEDLLELVRELCSEKAEATGT